uniref:LutC/YkgG family protein n=1 Tax=Halomonas sp. TaxID=1486246 RepID=UPI00262C6380|nr:lactate utilization protein [Halomonas sp.]
MTARDRILGRLRKGREERMQRDGGRGIVIPEADASVIGDRGWSRQERLQRFERWLTSVHGEVIHCETDDWTETLCRILKQKGIKRLALGHEQEVARQARQALEGKMDIALVDAARDVESWQQELFSQVDAGLTSTGGAIAETGSLWLWPTVDEPRLLSLVPPIHIAILDAEAIEDTFHDVMVSHEWAGSMPTNALLVSGPSKTADIEQTLAYGVHGPRELVVILRH